MDLDAVASDSTVQFLCSATRRGDGSRGINAIRPRRCPTSRRRGRGSSSAGTKTGGTGPAAMVTAGWGTGPKSVNAGLLATGRGLARRKPRLSLRLPGSSLLRFAARTFLASLFQEPPRFTRFEPVSPPYHHRDSRRTSGGTQRCRHGPRVRSCCSTRRSPRARRGGRSAIRPAARGPLGRSDVWTPRFSESFRERPSGPGTGCPR